MTSPTPRRSLPTLLGLVLVLALPAGDALAAGSASTTLAWHTLHNAIIGARDPAKTE